MQGNQNVVKMASKKAGSKAQERSNYIPKRVRKGGKMAYLDSLSSRDY